MKKFLAILLTVILSFSLYSCDNKKQDDSANTQQETVKTPEPVSVELSLYNINENLKEEVSEIQISADATIQEKMLYLASALSGKFFNGNTIEVGVKEETNTGAINLKDTPDHEWHSYFQGSQGGYATEYKLIKTMLQPDFEGDWIDSIEIHYNGEPAFEKFEHFCLYEKYERSEIDSYFSE